MLSAEAYTRDVFPLTVRLPSVDISVPIVVAAATLTAPANNMPNKANITARRRPRNKFFMKKRNLD